MDESFFADDLAVYITTRNQRVASRALQEVNNKLDAWTVKRGLTFSTSKIGNMVFIKRRKRNEKPIKITLRNKVITNKENT